MADGAAGQGNSIDTISIRITASATQAARSIDQLTNSLTNLRNAVSNNLSGLSSLSSSLGTLSASLTGLRNNASDLGGLRTSLQQISRINMANVTSGLREIASLNFNINSVRDAMTNLQGLTQQITGLSDALRNVPDFNLRGFGQINNQLRNGTTHSNRFAFSLSGIKGAITAIASSRAVGALKNSIKNTNDYIEAMNLATVSLGNFSDEAVRFGETVSSALGVDQGVLLENMGLFQNLSTSFGVSADNAYILSKNMAQLAYDFASFHNLDIEESFLKFQSALAGELEPIRRVGVDISNARLQQELYDLGLQNNISTLNRADKAILTYIAIMKQSTNEMGDMARTIQSPANMLRVLGNQATITGRQIGALFIPALQEILPWAIAVMKVIGQLAASLASLVGFNMEDYMTSVDGNAFEGMAGDIEDVGTAAGKAAKKMNNLIGGFDELNILKKASESAGTGVIGGNLLDNIDLTKYQYDMLEGLVPTDDLVNEVKATLESLLEPFNNVSLENTAQRFKDFFATIKEQTTAFDWGDLGSGLWESWVGTFSKISELVSNIAFPILGSFNIPEVVFSGLTALKDGYDALGKVIEAINPGVSSFIQKTLSPMAGVIGQLVTEGFAALSDQFQKFGEWVGGFGERFSKLSESVNKFAGYIGELLKPLKDAIWPTFSVLLDSIRGAFQAVIDNVVGFGRYMLDSANIVLEWADKVGVIDALKEKLKDVFEGSVEFAAGLIDALSGVINFTTGALTQDWNVAWDGIKQTFGGVWDAILGILQTFFGDFEQEMTDWWKNDVKPWFTFDKWKALGKDAIDGLFGGLKTIGNKIGNFFNNLMPSSFSIGVAENYYGGYGTRSYNSGGIPQLASGNVATDPTLALFGEYPGAKQNPEITAPQSTIYETVIAANGEMVGAVYQMANMIVQAIENNATEVSADSEGIFKAVRKGAAEYKKSHGVPAF